jgi:lipoate-protein ligase A
MTEKWRLLDLGYVDPVSYWTYPEAVTMAKASGKVPNTIVFSIPNKKTINVGYYQDVEKEVNLSLCKEMGVDVVRRFGFGGGALLYDDNSRLFHIIVDSNRFPKNYEELMICSSQGLLNGVHNLGIEAKFVPINDVITSSGKKIGMCSNFRTDFENVTYVTISLHRDVDIDLAMQLITPPAEKFKDKDAKAVKDRITTISKELGHLVSTEDLMKATRKGFEEAYGIELYDGELTQEEKEYHDKAIKRNSSIDFLYKYSEKVKFRDEIDLIRDGKLIRSEFIYKGKKLIRVVVLIDTDHIKNIMISGDYYAYPWNITDQIESILKGCPVDKNIVRKEVNKKFKETNGEVALISPDEFADTIIGALEKA